MDTIDDDSQMLDAYDGPMREPVGRREALGKLKDSLAVSTGSNSPSRSSRTREPSRQGTPLSANGALNSSVKRLRERSRESSVLANSVANHLSIGSPSNGVQGKSTESIDDSDIEHEPNATYNSSLPTGLCYDVRMRYHCELDPPKQRLDFHPEDPRRIFKIYKELCMAGLVKDNLLNTGALIPNPLVRISARNVSEEEVCLVHDKKHYDFMRTTASMFAQTPFPSSRSKMRSRAPSRSPT